MERRGLDAGCCRCYQPALELRPRHIETALAHRRILHLATPHHACPAANCKSKALVHIDLLRSSAYQQCCPLTHKSKCDLLSVQWPVSAHLKGPFSAPS